MLKGIGALLILASAAGIGASFSSDLKGRCMELRLLKQMIGKGQIVRKGRGRNTHYRLVE